MITEMRRNTAIRILIIRICFESVSSFFINGLIRSMVRVELDVSTREESVDIEAESTSTTTTPISISGSAESSIAGTIESNASLPFEPFSIRTLPVAAASSGSAEAYSLPKPPIKYEPPATIAAKIVEITVPLLIAVLSLIA